MTLKKKREERKEKKEILEMTTDVVFELHNEQESMLFEMMLSLERDFELDS